MILLLGGSSIHLRQGIKFILERDIQFIVLWMDSHVLIMTVCQEKASGPRSIHLLKLKLSLHSLAA